MGRNNQKGRGGKQPKQPKTSTSREQHGRYKADVVTQGTRVEAYYRAQAIAPVEVLDAIFEAFRQPLPTTFRVTGSRANVEDINGLITSTHIPELADVEYEGQKQDPPRQISWYPDGLAWSFNVAKKVIRKSPEFKKFQSFLVHETEAGNISRQEAVSMIPPLLMDVQPHHYVLDMCAAPGSKSAQLLEALHATPGVEPTGFLVANDSDAKRTHMLIHQTLGRLGSPNMLVTNLDASNLPNVRIRAGKGDATRVLQYDRILADVPCSGDGTLRKNVEIWQKWTPFDALGLHSLQLRILLRGLQNLKPGGRLVYSTCSLNPIENEAVISAALHASKGSVALIDVSDRLPDLQRVPGLQTWHVLDDENKPIEAPSDGGKEATCKGRPLVASMWPNGKEAEQHLERCLRIYPHLQDTGGFFVAVLEKAGKPEPGADRELSTAAADVEEATMAVDAVAPPLNDSAPVDDASTEPAVPVASTPASDAEPPAKRPRLDPGDDAKAGVPVKPGSAKNPGREFREEPYSYVAVDHPEMQSALAFFGIRPATFDPANLLVRNDRGEPLRTVYHTSASVRAVVDANDYQRIRLVGCGAKLFARQDANKLGLFPCRWRILSDSVHFIRPHVAEARVVRAGLPTLRTLMDHYVDVEAFDEEGVRARLAEMGLGSALLEVQPGTDAAGAILRQPLVLPIWQAPKSLQLMIEKKEKSALSHRVFGKDVTTNTPLKRDNATAAETEPAEGDAPVEANVGEGIQAETADAEILDTAAVAT